MRDCVRALRVTCGEHDAIERSRYLLRLVTTTNNNNLLLGY